MNRTSLGLSEDWHDMMKRLAKRNNVRFEMIIDEEENGVLNPHAYMLKGTKAKDQYVVKLWHTHKIMGAPLPIVTKGGAFKVFVNSHMLTIEHGKDVLHVGYDGDTPSTTPEKLVDHFKMSEEFLPMFRFCLEFITLAKQDVNVDGTHA